MCQMGEKLRSLITLAFQKWKICSLSAIHRKREGQIAEKIPALDGTWDTGPLQLC